jgi:hypothetical protein
MKWNYRLDLATMRAQISLAFALLFIFALMNGAILFIVAIRKTELSGASLTLVTTGLTAAITLCGTAVGYFFNRHRPQNGADGTDDSEPANPIQPPTAAK